MIDDTKQNKIEGSRTRNNNKRRSDWYFLFQYLVAPKGAIWLVVLKNQCGPSCHLPGFSIISWGGPSCTSLVICCGPSRHFPRFSTISSGEDLVQAFCWSIFFACVLVKVQFLGYKFGLKGSTYTRENTVTVDWKMPKQTSANCCQQSSGRSRESSNSSLEPPSRVQFRTTRLKIGYKQLGNLRNRTPFAKFWICHCSH